MTTCAIGCGCTTAHLLEQATKYRAEAAALAGAILRGDTRPIPAEYVELMRADTWELSMLHHVMRKLDSVNDEVELRRQERHVS